MGERTKGRASTTQACPFAGRLTGEAWRHSGSGPRAHTVPEDLGEGSGALSWPVAKEPVLSFVLC